MKESQRKVLDWKEGNAYFLPVNKGMACGWICRQTNDKSETAPTNLSADKDNKEKATIYVMKATPQALEDDIDNKTPTWVAMAKESFTSLIQTQEAAKEDNNNLVLEGIGLTAKDSNKIRSIVVDAMDNSAHAREQQ